MIPKKPNILYKQVAEDLNVSETLVDNFMTFYYKEIRKNLTELNHIRINLDGLGIMSIKPRLVTALLDKYHNSIETLNTDTIANYNYKKRIEAKVILLEKADKMLKADKEIKDKFLKDKADGKAKGNLEQ